MSKIEDQNKFKEDTPLSFLDDLRRRGFHTDGSPLRLHLGCGENYLEGYINIDYPQSEHTVQGRAVADLYADITTLIFPEQSVDEIRLHHVFEHFNRAHALALLIRWHQWLKIGGKLHIETPDIIGCSHAIASDTSYKIKQAVIRHLFGSHEAHWAYHLDGWFEEKFQKVLSSFGFSVQCRTWQWQHEPYLSNVEAVGIKRIQMTRTQLLNVGESLLVDSMVADVPSEHSLHRVWSQEMRSFLDRNTPPPLLENSSDNIPETVSALEMLRNMTIYPDTPDSDQLGYDNDRPETNGEYHLLSYLIEQGNTVFDVGANVGNWSKQVLMKIPNVHIHAFEPVPDLYNILRESSRGNPAFNIHNLAISDQDGTRTFFYYNKSTELSGMSSFYRRPDPEKRLAMEPVQIQVLTQTLDSFCKTSSIQQIDFLKIDTEGGELDVLHGAIGLLKKQQIIALQFEYGGTYLDSGITLRQVLSFLAHYGYNTFRILPDGILHISGWHESLENYRYANYLSVAPIASKNWRFNIGNDF